jgi:hypothetical protein
MTFDVHTAEASTTLEKNRKIQFSDRVGYGVSAILSPSSADAKGKIRSDSMRPIQSPIGKLALRELETGAKSYQPRLLSAPSSLPLDVDIGLDGMPAQGPKRNCPPKL